MCYRLLSAVNASRVAASCHAAAVLDIRKFGPCVEPGPSQLAGNRSLFSQPNKL